MVIRTRRRLIAAARALVEQGTTVLIDPFGPLGDQAAARGMVFDYTPIDAPVPDLLLITHEHPDHNAAEVVAGSPAVIRSTAGSLESPIGLVIAVASEHDAAAGTERGPNTIFRFELDRLRVCLSATGQSELRPEQARAIGEIDLLFVPAGSADRGRRDGCRSSRYCGRRSSSGTPHPGLLPRAARRVRPRATRASRRPAERVRPRAARRLR
jgi:L-ascorbate metabolism protein UlaG (beta-lactamase superfamily)